MLVLVLVTTVYVVCSESSTLSALDERTASSTRRQLTNILHKVESRFTHLRPGRWSAAVFCENTLKDRIQ